MSFLPSEFELVLGTNTEKSYGLDALLKKKRGGEGWVLYLSTPFH